MHPVQQAARELGWERFTFWAGGLHIVWTTDETKAKALEAAGASLRTATKENGMVEGWECSWNEEVAQP